MGFYRAGTDGGCRGNPGIGAWAFVIDLPGKGIKGRSGFAELTTNNEMELRALLEFMLWLDSLKEPIAVEVFVDSAYTVNGFNSWMENWKKRMWRTSSNSTVKNKTLWHDVYHLNKALVAKGFTLKVTKVKGHSGHDLNDAADLRCNVLMDEYELNQL